MTRHPFSYQFAVIFNVVEGPWNKLVPIIAYSIAAIKNLCLEGCPLLENFGLLQISDTGDSFHKSYINTSLQKRNYSAFEQVHQLVISSCMIIRAAVIEN